ncbi:MAG: imidazole glycerol phosphate synthase subunit HisF [Candidatus Micrarchaeia archaeon]
MLSKRIIPCLDVDKRGVVKGKKFQELKKAGDPVALALKYYEDGADELVFLDITATLEGREAFFDVVKQVSKEVFIPLTVGGGIRILSDFDKALSCGADKVSVNSAAIKDPSFVEKASKEYGSQCVVVAIDAKKDGRVFSRSATSKTSLDATSWAKKVAELGAGEILLTCIDCDGTNSGFDLGLTRSVSKSVGVPVVASGGAGKPADMLEVLTKGCADAALAAGIFHFDKYSVQNVKSFLDSNGVCVRL